MLGVRPEFDGLYVNPCIGDSVSEFTVTRKCRGATYVIRVQNSGGGSPAKLTLDGEPIEGNLVPYAPAGTTVTVDCEV